MCINALVIFHNFVATVTVLIMLERQSDTSKTRMLRNKEDISLLNIRIDELEQNKTYLLEENMQLQSQLKDTHNKLDGVREELRMTKQMFDKNQEEIEILNVKCSTDHELEIKKYKSTIQELSTSLREYQSKVCYHCNNSQITRKKCFVQFSSMTTKMKQLSEKMIMEKTSSDKAKKAFSSQLSNQTAEAKKAVLEVSQMKVYINIIHVCTITIVTTFVCLLFLD